MKTCIKHEENKHFCHKNPTTIDFKYIWDYFEKQENQKSRRIKMKIEDLFCVFLIFFRAFIILK
jgi:hypothetical protein